jgi:hypothetical protein
MLDWSLEALALVAVLGQVYLLIANWHRLPTAPTRLRFPGSPEPWDMRTSLAVMGALGVLGYLGMTIATHYQKLFHIPEQLDRNAPHVRQVVFSMGIMLKSVLMIVSLYLTWVLVNLAQGRFVGLGRRYITVMVLLVLVPFGIYVFKLRRRQP